MVREDNQKGFHPLEKNEKISTFLTSSRKIFE